MYIVPTDYVCIAVIIVVVLSEWSPVESNWGKLQGHLSAFPANLALVVGLVHHRVCVSGKIVNAL